MKSGGNGARSPPPRPPRPAARPRPSRWRSRSRARRSCRTASASPPSRAASPQAEGIDLASVHGSGPGGRILKADVLGSNGNGAAARAKPQENATLIKGASAMLARYMDESRSIPTATSFRTLTVTTLDAPPQGAQGRRPQGLVHPPDRLRDRPRRHRADAGDGPSLRRDRRQAAPRRRRRRQPRHRGRRREEGRRPHADGPGHPRRRAPELLRLPRRLQRPDRPRPREQADRRRSRRAPTSRSPTPAGSERSLPFPGS